MIASRGTHLYSVSVVCICGEVLRALRACTYACMFAMHVCNICVYVCVCVCVCVCALCAYVCMHVFMHVCMHALLHVCIHVCMHVFAYVWLIYAMLVCMHAPRYACVCICVRRACAHVVSCVWCGSVECSMVPRDAIGACIDAFIHASLHVTNACLHIFLQALVYA